MDDMAVAHARDTRYSRNSLELRLAIARFLNDDAHRITPEISDALGRADFALKSREDHIVAVWN